MEDSGRQPNRLISQSSPYLRQHAHNPVDWYPWGTDALDRAWSEDKPILLSVGYSACHWCHVMERESFEDDKIAATMNEYFICIKVDREERPDVDEIYMGAVQAMTGSGGWPMTVFLTPDRKPFYGGTYFPPTDMHGRPGFPTVLKAVGEHFRQHRDKTEDQANKLVAVLEQSSDILAARELIGSGILQGAYDQLRQNFDSTYGGFGGAPKFPGSMSLSTLLRHYRRTGDEHAAHMVDLSLRSMARGGMYDQLGGGFHRYSVDEKWLVPHFEKMLYDNALLVWTYLEAYQSFGEELFRQVVEETLEYVMREMSHPEGGYYSAQDADSEGEEGLFFVWRPDEVEELLGADDAALFCRYFEVTDVGNFEDSASILHVDTEISELAKFLNIEEARLEEVVSRGRQRLMSRRQERIPPATDDKILVSWNGLMISAMAQAHKVLGDKRFLHSAEKAAEFILTHMVDESDALLHTCRDGEAAIAAFQDDYACLINGLVDLYEASWEPKWLVRAQTLTGSMLERFWDDEEGGFFFTEAGADDLILRTRNPFDNATPSGSSMAALALLRLSALTDDASLRSRAEHTLRLYADLMERSPTACPQMLIALDYFEDSPYEIAIVGGGDGREELERAIHTRFLPNKVVSGALDGEVDAAVNLPLLEGKTGVGKRSTVYVCRDSVCSQPMTERDELLELLDTTVFSGSARSS